jgi:Bacterial SH3 domain
MSPTSKIGFHAAFKLREGVPHEYGAGNAMVGAYLNELGLSYAAVAYITGTEPTSMKWLTPEDAKRYGIAYQMMEDKPAPGPTTPALVSPPTPATVPAPPVAVEAKQKPPFSEVKPAPGFVEGPTGYVPKQYAQSFRVAGVASDDVLNVRNGPSADHALIGRLPPDADGIRIAGASVSAWCPIQHRGLSGWVNRVYLKLLP